MPDTLTEADVRRIVDERIAEAKAREHPSDIARMERERATRMSEPPSPAPAQRVEAWRAHDGPPWLYAGHPGRPSDYLTTFPGVHNAADAAALEAAVREIVEQAKHRGRPIVKDLHDAADALARFLAPEAGRPPPGDPTLTAVEAKRRIAEVFADRDHPYFLRDDPRHAHAVEEVRKLFEVAYG